MVKIDKKIVGFRIIENAQHQSSENLKEEKSLLLRTSIVKGYTLRIKYSDHSLYFTLNFDKHGNLLEMFVNSSSTSPTINAYIQAIARMVSNQLKYKIPKDKIVKHLDGLDSGESVLVKFPGIKKSKFIKSIPDLMAKILSFYSDQKFLESVISQLEEEAYQNREAQNEVKSESKFDEPIQIQTEMKINREFTGLVCPSCGEASMKYEEGCYTCLACGYSKCS